MHFVARTIYQEALGNNDTQEHTSSIAIKNTIVENSEQSKPQGTIHFALTD